MYNKPLIILILIFLFAVEDISAQDYNLLFDHLTVNDGLSDNNILDIMQDHDGFMWFATDNGLNKYDGYKFKVYSDGDKPGDLISDNIVVVFEDSYGIFWIGTDASGLSFFDKEKERFHNFIHDNKDTLSVSSNKIRAIYEDSDKELWIGTAGGGLCLFNRADSTFVNIRHHEGEENTLGSNYIGSITGDKNGNLWIGTTVGKLIRFNKKDSVFTAYTAFDTVNGDVLSPVTGRVIVDSDNDVWFLTTEGVAVLNPKTGVFRYLNQGSSGYGLSTGNATDILEYKKGVFFILIDHGGIIIYDKKTGEIYRHREQKYDNKSVSSDQVQAIYRSKDGMVWIGTYNSGLNILRDKDRFYYYGDLLRPQDKLKCCNSTLSMCEDAGGNIWLGYDGEGIDIWDPVTREIKRHITTKDKNTIKCDIVSALYRDHYGDIWIGYFLEGMSVFNPQTNTFKYFRQNAHDENDQYLNNVWCVLQDSRDKYWIGTHYGGLKLFDLKSNKFDVYCANNDTVIIDGCITEDYISKIFKDSKGRLWVGTIDGLNLYNEATNSFSTYTEKDIRVNHIVGAWVRDIYESADGKIWVATEKALNMFCPETNGFIHYDTKDGMRGSDIKCILGDKNDNLWFSTNKGITQYNYKTDRFWNFDVSEYLQGKEFTPAAGVIASDGSLYFGSQNGFVTFSPDKFKQDRNKYPIFITKVEVVDKAERQGVNKEMLDRSIEFVDTINLSYQQNELLIGFSYLNFYFPERNQYKYKLEGYDQDWVFNGTKNEVKYTNLDPGVYVFKVMGANRDRVWNENYASVVINISPPFWKTLWFVILEILFVIGAVVLIFNYRNRHLQREKRKLQLMVADRTKELQEQAEELREMNIIVEESREEVMQQNEKLIQYKNNLERIVEERTKELKKAKEKAEEADRLKSAFLANMSHEIRTPLNAIVGFSRILSETDPAQEERVAYSNIINESSDSLLMLVNDILDFSSIEANQLEIKKTGFGLRELFDNLYSTFSVSNKNNEVSLVLKAGEDMNIFTDRLRLRQILVNLLQNAFKFTKKGYVELGYCEDKGELILYVKDTGIGISPEDQKYIFDRFRKSDKQSDKAVRGIGLGLTISKRLGGLLGGSLTVESEEGKGSVFYLSFPIEVIQ